MSRFSDRVKGLAERVAWTAAQAAVGVLAAPEVVDTLGIPESYKAMVVVAIAALSSYVKNKVAERVNGSHQLGIR